MSPVAEWPRDPSQSRVQIGLPNMGVTCLRATISIYIEGSVLLTNVLMVLRRTQEPWNGLRLLSKSFQNCHDLENGKNGKHSHREAQMVE